MVFFGEGGLDNSQTKSWFPHRKMRLKKQSCKGSQRGKNIKCFWTIQLPFLMLKKFLHIFCTPNHIIHSLKFRKKDSATPPPPGQKNSGSSLSLSRTLPFWTFTDCVTGQATFLFFYFPVLAQLAVVTIIGWFLSLKHAFRTLLALCIRCPVSWLVVATVFRNLVSSRTRRTLHTACSLFMVLVVTT